jgi:hypothetical protein
MKLMRIFFSEPFPYNPFGFFQINKPGQLRRAAKGTEHSMKKEDAPKKKK